MTPVDELLVRLFRAPRILVVDDKSSPVEGLLHRYCECHVDRASTGERAVELLGKYKYDMVFLDLAMLNGTSNTVVAAAQRLCPSVPIVAINLCHDMPPYTLTLLSQPVTLSTVASVFQLFKVKVRTREIAEYCDHRVSAPMLTQAQAT